MIRVHCNDLLSITFLHKIYLRQNNKKLENIILTTSSNTYCHISPYVHCTYMYL